MPKYEVFGGNRAENEVKTFDVLVVIINHTGLFDKTRGLFLNRFDEKGLDSRLLSISAQYFYHNFLIFDLEFLICSRIHNSNFVLMYQVIVSVYGSKFHGSGQLP